jgi:hypothetical protein
MNYLAREKVHSNETPVTATRSVHWDKHDFRKRRRLRQQARQQT